MGFTPDITALQLGLLIASAGLTVVALIAVLIRVIPLRRHALKAKSRHSADRNSLSSAAVIVYTRDDHESLAEMLPQVLNQNYPSGYEVIVVNDGEAPLVHDLVAHLMLTYPNLYYTSAPDGARNLSRKKLALTLGIKAAKAPVVVHTTSSARIGSADWLYSIMRHFEPDGNVDVVIGYAAAPPRDDRSFGAMARAFDSSVHDLGWIAPACSGHPWRANENNLAYRRDVFFRNKGFSRHLNLRDGDDDIFVSEIARGFNTVVELSPESYVEVPGANCRRPFTNRINRHRFTGRFIPRRPRIAGTLATISYFLAPLPLIAVPIIGNMDAVAWIYWSVAFVCWFAAGLTWNVALTLLRCRKLNLSTPFLALTRPLRISCRTLKSMISHSKRYTWE